MTSKLTLDTIFNNLDQDKNRILLRDFHKNKKNLKKAPYDSHYAVKFNKISQSILTLSTICSGRISSWNKRCNELKEVSEYLSLDFEDMCHESAMMELDDLQWQDVSHLPAIQKFKNAFFDCEMYHNIADATDYDLAFSEWQKYANTKLSEYSNEYLSFIKWDPVTIGNFVGGAAAVLGFLQTAITYNALRKISNDIKDHSNLQKLVSLKLDAIDSRLKETDAKLDYCLANPGSNLSSIAQDLKECNEELNYISTLIDRRLNISKTHKNNSSVLAITSFFSGLSNGANCYILLDTVCPGVSLALGAAAVGQFIVSYMAHKKTKELEKDITEWSKLQKRIPKLQKQLTDIQDKLRDPKTKEFMRNVQKLRNVSEQNGIKSQLEKNFRKYKIQRWYNIIVEKNGYDEINAILELNNEDLREIGIEKTGHRRQILKGIEKWDKDNKDLEENVHKMDKSNKYNGFVGFIARNHQTINNVASIGCSVGGIMMQN